MAAARITITCATEGATIYYTLDGTEPSQESTLYTDRFMIYQTTTIKAKAYLDGLLDSEIAERTVVLEDPTVTLVTPIVEFQTGDTIDTGKIVITNSSELSDYEDNFTIYYTTDGSEPTTESESLPSGTYEIAVDGNFTYKIKVIATGEGVTDSETVTIEVSTLQVQNLTIDVTEVNE